MRAGRLTSKQKCFPKSLKLFVADELRQVQREVRGHMSLGEYILYSMTTSTTMSIDDNSNDKSDSEPRWWNDADLHLLEILHRTVDATTTPSTARRYSGNTNATFAVCGVASINSETVLRLRLEILSTLCPVKFTLWTEKNVAVHLTS